MLSFYLMFFFIAIIIKVIVRDIKNVDKDYQRSIKTIPILFGRKRANKVAIGFSVLLLLFLIIIIREFLIERPLFLGYSILFLLLPISYFIYKLYSAESKKEYSFLSKLINSIMFFGILSMVLFKFI